MKSCLPTFPDSTRPRRDGAPSDWRSAGPRQNTLPPLNFERLSFLADLDVIEHFDMDEWFKAVAETGFLSHVEAK